MLSNNCKKRDRPCDWKTGKKAARSILRWSTAYAAICIINKPIKRGISLAMPKYHSIIPITRCPYQTRGIKPRVESIKKAWLFCETEECSIFNFNHDVLSFFCSTTATETKTKTRDSTLRKRKQCQRCLTRIQPVYDAAKKEITVLPRSHRIIVNIIPLKINHALHQYLNYFVLQTEGLRLLPTRPPSLLRKIENALGYLIQCNTLKLQIHKLEWSVIVLFDPYAVGHWRIPSLDLFPVHMGRVLNP